MSEEESKQSIGCITSLFLDVISLMGIVYIINHWRDVMAFIGVK